MIRRLLNRRFKHRREPLETDDRSAQINLERVGRGRIDEMVASTRKVPWVLTLLQLLWTAGPVTFLAMQGGSYLGYGEPVSVDTYVFFAFYVVLAALIGIVARIVADLIRGKKQNQARANVTRTLDVAPDLILTFRDLHLSLVPQEQRQREAAAILLGKLDVGPTSIAMAVEDITGDPELAAIAQRIEIYRRAGMFSRVEDWVLHSNAQRETALAGLPEHTAEVRQALERRLLGLAPSQETGIPRSRNFIGQIFAAAHHDDLALMSLADIEDLLLLIFELLSGRQITRLTIDYEGDWKLAKALDEVERTQNDYRQVKAAAHLRLHDLTWLLAESGLAGLDSDLFTLAAGERLERSRDALRLLAEQLNREQARGAARKRLQNTLRRAQHYAALTRQAIERLNDRHRRKVRALEHWEQLRRRHLPLSGGAQYADHRKQGLRIRESSIGLTDEQKLALAADFCRYLDDMQITPGGHGIMRRGASLKVDDAKRLGIHLALVLEDLIDLDNPSVQRAIESSNGIFLEGLEIGFSADAKAGLGAAAVKEIQENLGPAAELIALRLTRLYRLPLTPPIIEFLSENYGADRQRLQYLADTAEHAERSGEFATGVAPPPQSDTYDQWLEPIRSIDKLLARLVR